MTIARSTDQTEALHKAFDRAFRARRWIFDDTFVRKITESFAAEGVFVATEAARKVHENLSLTRDAYFEGSGHDKNSVGSEGALWNAISDVLAAGPLPPRECAADGMSDAEIGRKVIELGTYNSFNEKGFGKAIRALFQPSPASGEQDVAESPLAAIAKDLRDGTFKGVPPSVAGDINPRNKLGDPIPPRAEPPAPAATRVAVRVELTRPVKAGYEAPWQIKNPSVEYRGHFPWETRYATLHADLPGDGG